MAEKKKGKRGGAPKGNSNAKKPHNYPEKRKSTKKPGPKRGPKQTFVQKAGLTDMEWEAVNHYFTPEVNFNKTEALRRAGYAHPAAQVSRVFGRKEVVAELDKRRKARTEQFKVGEAEVLSELQKIAFYNIYDFCEQDEDGKLIVDSRGYASISLANATREQMAAISEFVVETHMEGRGEDAVPVTKLKFKPLDKMAALDKLCRHLGLFNDKLKVEAGENFANAILEAKKRIREGE